MSQNEVLSIDQLDMLRRERIALSKLTDKQKAFCETYCRTFDKISAMKAGGYYLPKETRKGGSQQALIEKNFNGIMASAAVQEYIFLLKQSVASRLNVSMDAIIDEYKSMAFTNIDDYVEWSNDGFTTFKSSDELTRAQKAGILEITETTTKSGSTIKIKLHNKQTSLDRLFDVLKELEEKDSKPDPTARISQTQINVILQDPIKRRAIEHLAEGMFTKQIHLVGTDKDRLEFDKHLTKITTRLLEATSGVKGSGRIGGAGIPAPGEIEAGGNNAADHSGEDTAGKKPVGEGQGVLEGETEGDAGVAAESDIAEGRRYDIDGL